MQIKACRKATDAPNQSGRTGHGIHSWQRWILSATCQLYDCVIVGISKYRNGRRTKNYEIYGREGDVKTVELMFEYFVEAVRKRGSAYRKETGCTSTQREKFIRGCAL